MNKIHAQIFCKYIIGDLLLERCEIFHQNFNLQKLISHKVRGTVNPQNYTGVNFHESAQYSNSVSKTFAV